MKLAPLLVVLVAGCHAIPDAYHCDASKACMRGSSIGTCESTGYCAFPDPSCPDGKYDRSAGPYANLCVGTVLDLGTTDAATVDGNTSVPDGGPGSVALLAGKAGGSGTHDDVGQLARLQGAASVAVDGTTLYFTDLLNNLVRSVDLGTGAVTTIAGSKILGGGRVDGPGTSALVERPAGLVRLGGTTYFVEQIIGSGGGALRSIDASGNVATLASGLNQPYALATDGTDLYVGLQFDGTVQRFSTTGAPGAVIAMGFTLPTAMTYIPAENALYLVDGLTAKLTRITLGTTPAVDQVVLSGQTLNGPFGISPAPGSGSPVALLVTDSYGHQIALATATSSALARTLTTWAGAAEGIADGTRASAGMLSPSGIFTSGTTVYVGDENTLRRIDDSLTPQVLTIAGLQPTNTPTDGVGTQIHFDAPQGLARASDGTLYVSETNGVIRVLTPSGSSYSSTTAPTSTTLHNPQGLALDGDVLYVADTDYNTGAGSLAVYSRSSLSSGPTIVSTCGGNALATPFAIAVDPGVGAYFSDQSEQVICWLPHGSSTATIVAGAYGVSSEQDQSTALSARFQTPSGLALVGTSLYVVDALPSTLRRIVLSSAGVGGAVSTIAGVAYDRTKLTTPDQLATDGTSLVLGELDGDRLRWFTTAGVEMGSIGMAGEGAVRTGATPLLNQPAGLVVTSDGVLFVARTENVLLLALPP